MKNILRRFHIGSNHDPSRSNEIHVPSPSSSPTCGSDHRSGATSVTSVNPPSPSLSEAPPEASTALVEAKDYFSSEEEYQIQLAMAISASNSELRKDPDVDQIRAATLLSLGTHRSNLAGEDVSSAEAMSRRYWDYNLVDYDESILDGFYDIYGLSSAVCHGKMPSFVDLQTSIGDLGFEVIIVNRAIDPALVELEQVAQCIYLDFRDAEVGFSVQRLSELVAQHMGGPVRDAHDMLATWMEKSTELRRSQQTSLLPVGCINIGLSRHRALLFKILSDKVGISCKLVKGRHYTGIDDDAVNIIKFGDGREFLVDLMAAPGTLIPADVLNGKDVAESSYNESMNQKVLPWAASSSSFNLLKSEQLFGRWNGETGASTSDTNRVLDQSPRHEKALLLPEVPAPCCGPSSTITVSSSNTNAKNSYSPDKFGQFSTITAASSNQKEIPEVTGSESSQDTVDSRILFSELDPFQAIGVGRSSVQFQVTDNKNIWNQRRQNIAAGPDKRPPLVLKNRAPCNVNPYRKVNNNDEGLPQKKNIGAVGFNNASSAHSSNPTGREYSEAQNVRFAVVPALPDPGRVGASGNCRDASTGSTSCPSGGDNLGVASGNNDNGDGDEGYINLQPSKQLLLLKPSGEHYMEKDERNELVFQSRMTHELQEIEKNIDGRHNNKEIANDRFMGTDLLEDLNSKASSSQARPSRLASVFDDVAELEIPWEHLIIGERIGLGSYGEVYHADWNGTEVAVKKFLDQDFYGKSLDEFRSEVRIMRRLRHPNVVLFMGAVTRPPNLSIVSEFLKRGSLYSILHRRNCQIDEKRRIKMALDVAKGMNCLHTSIPTIVHRDLKSPNLLVDKNWTVKVCDFGLSRLKHSTFLSSKSSAGTPEWMAPEVLRNEPSNEKCDVYSFGVILWELATLKRPWNDMNQMQVVGAVGFQDRRMDIPKEVDPMVSEIIRQCWQTEPSLRPSFAQLTTALKSLQRLGGPAHQESQSVHPLSQ